MDLFEAACQGIGLSLAAGVLAGAVAAAAEDERGSPGPLLLILLALAVLGGGYMFGASLSAEDHPAWPGWFVGGAIALFAFGIARGVVSGAAHRAGEQGSAGTIVAHRQPRRADHRRALAPLGPARAPRPDRPGRCSRSAAGARRCQKHEGLRSLR